MNKQLFTISFLAVGLSISSLSLAQEQTPPKLPPQATEFYTQFRKSYSGANNSAPPSDAIVIFDGSNLNGFVSAKDGSSPAAWTLENGELVVVKGKGDIQSCWLLRCPISPGVERSNRDRG